MDREREFEKEYIVFLQATVAEDAVTLPAQMEPVAELTLPEAVLAELEEIP